MASPSDRGYIRVGRRFDSAKCDYPGWGCCHYILRTLSFPLPSFAWSTPLLSFTLLSLEMP